MTNLLRAEIRKVRATSVTWWLLLSTVAIGILGTLAPLIAVDGKPVDLLSDHQIRAALHGAAGGAVLVLVAGIIGMAGEWRFGQVGQAFLSTPRRWRVVTIKTIIYLGVGTVYGVAAALAATATAWGWYRAKHLALPFDRSAVWLTLAGCVAVAALFGVLGVAIGAIVRRPVPAIVGALAWTVLMEPALFAAAPTVFRWLPGIASLSLRRQPAEHLLPVGTAAAVLLAVITTALAAGVRMVERDDVTG
jgi:ABC-2 type transport system permease protein